MLKPHRNVSSLIILSPLEGEQSPQNEMILEVKGHCRMMKLFSWNYNLRTNRQKREFRQNFWRLLIKLKWCNTKWSWTGCWAGTDEEARSSDGAAEVEGELNHRTGSLDTICISRLVVFPSQIKGLAKTTQFSILKTTSHRQPATAYSASNFGKSQHVGV